MTAVVVTFKLLPERHKGVSYAEIEGGDRGNSKCRNPVTGSPALGADGETKAARLSKLQCEQCGRQRQSLCRLMQSRPGT